MSDLQIGLAVIGALVIGVVIAYNRVQENRFRHRAETSFKQDRGDALLEPGVARARAAHRTNAISRRGRIRRCGVRPRRTHWHAGRRRQTNQRDSGISDRLCDRGELRADHRARLVAPAAGCARRPGQARAGACGSAGRRMDCARQCARGRDPRAPCAAIGGSARPRDAGRSGGVPAPGAAVGRRCRRQRASTAARKLRAGRPRPRPVLRRCRRRRGLERGGGQRRCVPGRQGAQLRRGSRLQPG